MSKLKDIFLKILGLIAAKLGYALLPIKEVNVDYDIVSPPKVEPTSKPEPTVFEELGVSRARVSEIMRMIMDNKYHTEFEFGEPTLSDSSEDIKKVNTIMKMVDTGDYEKGVVRKMMNHKIDNYVASNGDSIVNAVEMETQEFYDAFNRINVDEDLPSVTAKSISTKKQDSDVL